MPKQTNRGSLAKAKAREFDIISSFQYGYRNREDMTNLPPSTLITGSQNVLTNVSGRIGVRKGYILDGAADTSISSILGSYDYQMHTGTVRHLRSGFLTSAGNDGKLQFRYDNGTTVTWYDLLTGLTATDYNFCNYWDSTNLNSLCLMVNGASSITEWTGGVATFASATANTITLQGTSTFAQLGFYASGSHKVIINNIEYTATGGWGTTTLTGVTPDPTSVTITVGTVMYQKPETTLNSAMTSLPNITNDLIASLNNQVYVGSLTSQAVYISTVDAYKNYGFTSPTRLPGEGAVVELDGPARALIPSEDAMYMSAGQDQWWRTQFTLSSTLTAEKLQVKRLKTAGLQGAKSQGLTTKIANQIVFLSNEPIVQQLGFVENILTIPYVTDLSYPIVNDINGIGFNGQIIYHKKFIYLSDPTNSKVYVYNMTNPQNPYWEAPQILPIGRFSIIDGDLYGHSYNSSETYKLFDGYNDNGNFIESKAKFAYNSHGQRDNTKSFTDMYFEGYISSNTTLWRELDFDIDGCATVITDSILGSDTQIVCIGADDNLLGKESLGKNPLGGNLVQTTGTLPPKFRVIRTSVRVPYYEYSVTFYSNGKDQNWELIAFGPAWMRTPEGQSNITL